jgi:hypothetical protein
MTDLLEFPALKEAQGKLDERNKKLHSIFSEAGPEMDMAKVKSLDGDSAAKVEAIRALNEEIDAAGEEVDKLKAVARAAARSKDWDAAQEKGAESGAKGGKGREVEARKSFGEQFTDSIAFKGKQGSIGPEARLDIELKALFDTGAAGTPETVRGPADRRLHHPADPADRSHPADHDQPGRRGLHGRDDASSTTRPRSPRAARTPSRSSA